MLNKLQGQPDSYDKKFELLDPHLLQPLTGNPLELSTSLGERSVLAHMESFAKPNVVGRDTPSRLYSRRMSKATNEWSTMKWSYCSG